MNIEQARFNMVEQQIRTWSVLDQRVLDLFSSLPREEFVPEAYRRLAFADFPVPIGHGEFMWTPRLEGRVLQALALQPHERVLEIGTGTGFFTALLARSADQVISFDRIADFTVATRSRLARLGIANAEPRNAECARGHAAEAPYDAIVVTGSVPVLDPDLPAQLTVGGRLFVVVGGSPAMEARLITRVSGQEWTQEVLFETDLPPLVGVVKPPLFRL
jgi:protein-L-isoaspartate(D-aspartate) O-methyltransferase